MQLRPFLIKIKLKLKSWAVKYRPQVRPVTVNELFEKHWTGTWPDYEYFQKRTEPKFFFDSTRRDTYVAALNSRFQDEIAQIIANAENILDHKHDFLGSTETDLGSEIDWHLDFKSGFKWPLEHYSKIKIVDPNNNADVKVPWELSRLQILPTLGQAYWLTNDSKYANEFIKTIECWDRHNPVDRGVNWTCSMEVAIRAINIIWGLNYFSIDSKLSTEFIKNAMRLLYYHALHIERNLEFVDHGSNSNHLLANYLGLFYLGLMLPQFDRAGRWLKIGREGLEQEMLLQVNEDGGDYECSLSYHRLVLEMFLSAHILAARNDIKFSVEYINRLTKMVEFSATLTPQSGHLPAIGDNDDGFVLKLGHDNPHDHSRLIDVGSQLFEMKVPENINICQERLWYLGPDSLNRWPGVTRRKPKLLKNSGYAVVQNDRMHLVFNACSIGEKGLGGHKHNDLLAVTLEIDSFPFLIDTGTACYTSDFELRNQCRMTASHNTISIDDEEQCRFLPKALFFMFRDARPKIDLWTVTGDKVIMSGYHDGYARNGQDILHRRTVEVSLSERIIKINDEISGSGNSEHLFKCGYLTPFECAIGKSGNSSKIIASNDQTLGLEFHSDSRIHVRRESVDYYPRYGTSQKGTRLTCTSRTKLPFKLTTRLVHTGVALTKNSILKSDNIIRPNQVLEESR